MFNTPPLVSQADASEPSSLRLRRPFLSSRLLGAVAAVALGLSLPACGDDDDDSSSDAGPSDGKAGSAGKSTAGKGGTGGGSAGKGGSGGSSAGKGGAGGSSSGDDAGVDEGDSDAQFALISSVGTTETDSVTYFKVIDDIKSQELKYDDAREFPGSADAWVYDGFVFIMDSEALTITKFEYADGKLTEAAKIGFSNYGLQDFGFWTNIFISSTKAWVVNGTTEYIAWNPKTMEITGTIKLPKLDDRGELKPFGSYVDRSTVIRDGLLYHPYYYTDDQYFRFNEASTVLVYDTKTDKLVKQIEAPCPGLDYATQDADGNIYFSSWIFAPGGASQLDQPATCVAKIAKGADTATKAFDVKDVADGHEGGVLRFTGDGKGIFSVFLPEHASAEEKGDPAKTTYGNNWRFWSFDFATNKGAQIESLDWNSGAAYGATIDKKAYLLIPTDGYANTVVYDITSPASPKKIFQAGGWVLRLLKLPN